MERDENEPQQEAGWTDGEAAAEAEAGAEEAVAPAQQQQQASEGRRGAGCERRSREKRVAWDARSSGSNTTNAFQVQTSMRDPKSSRRTTVTFLYAPLLLIATAAAAAAATGGSAVTRR